MMLMVFGHALLLPKTVPGPYGPGKKSLRGPG